MPPHRIPFPAELSNASEGRGSEVATELRTVGSGSINAPRKRWGLTILLIYYSTNFFYLTNASSPYSLSFSIERRRQRKGGWGYDGIADGRQRRYKCTAEKVRFVNSLDLLFYHFILSNQCLLTIFTFLQHWAMPAKEGGVRLWRNHGRSAAMV